MNILDAASIADELSYSRNKWSLESVIELGNRLVTLALDENLPVVIAICYQGQKVFQRALPGTNAENDVWIQRKINSVYLTGHSSLSLRESLKEILNLNELEYPLHSGELGICGGGFPLHSLDNELVGVVVVSGLPHLEDHQLIIRVLADFPSEKEKKV